MSRALVCDQCGASLTLNARGDHEGGEDAAWLRVTTGCFETGWDVCSRSCAVQLVESHEVGEILDAELEAIASISRAIREGRERRAEDES